MRTETINIYKFDELNKKAQEKAIENNRYINVDFWEWYHNLLCDFIENTKNNYGIEIEEKNIDFSGFSNQGDGASFTSENIDTKKLIEVLHIDFKSNYLKNLFVEWFNNFEIYRTSFHYSHCHTVAVRWQNNFDYYNGGSHKRLASYFTQKATEIENKLEELKNKLCNTLYNELENEYEFLTSDSIIEDCLISNEYEFYSDGSIA